MRGLLVLQDLFNITNDHEGRKADLTYVDEKIEVVSYIAFFWKLLLCNYEEQIFTKSHSISSRLGACSKDLINRTFIKRAFFLTRRFLRIIYEAFLEQAPVLVAEIH